MNRFIFVLAGTTLVFASASAYLWQQERAGREQRAALEQRVKELESAPIIARTIPTTPAETPAPLETVPPPQPVHRPKPAAIRGAVVANSRKETSLSAGNTFATFAFARQDKLMADPEYRAAMRAQQRLMMPHQYPDLAEALQLQPEEAGKLMDLLADQQIANMDRRPPVGPDGSPDQKAMQEWHQQMQQQMQQQHRDNEAQIANLLGDGRLQEWKEYQSTMGARMQVKQLRDLMNSSSDPLRADQVQQIVTALATEQRRPNAEPQRNSLRPVAMLGTRVGSLSPAAPNGVAMMEQSLEHTIQYNQRMQDAAAPYLSARQQEQYKQILDQQVEMQRINLRMMRSQAEAEARGEIPNEDPTNTGTWQLVTGSGVVPSP